MRLKSAMKASMRAISGRPYRPWYNFLSDHPADQQAIHSTAMRMIRAAGFCMRIGYPYFSG
jgi:hypothetical protein